MLCAALSLLLVAPSVAIAFTVTAKNRLEWKVAGVYQKYEAPRRFRNSSVGNWTVRDKDGNDCIRIEFGAELDVRAIKAFNHSAQTHTFMDLLIDVPPGATADQNPLNCGNQTQTLLLNWTRTEVGNNGNETVHDYLRIIFELTQNGSMYGIHSFYANLTHWVNVTSVKNVSNPLVETTEEKLSYIILQHEATNPMLQIAAGRSYLCSEPNPVNLTSSEIIVGESLVGLPRNGTVHSRNVKFDAFRGSKAPKNDYRTPSDCTFQPNDVVPIAVGCALAGLVVVVLIAYIVGRRKNRRSGYQSV